MDPHDSFGDDPLRMLRAFRFASQLDFKIDKQVLEAITEMREELKTISAERIRDELSKLICGSAPARALRLADSTGITELFLPELVELKLEQDPVHRHKDVFQHTLAVVERTDPILELRLAALLHDIGKPKTRRFTPEGVTFHHHEVVGAKMAARRLEELRYPNEVVETVRTLIFLHHRFYGYGQTDRWTDSAVRRYVRDAGDRLKLLNALMRADCTTRDQAKARMLSLLIDDLEERIERLEEEEEISRIRPELDGRRVMEHLGIEPGPLVGEALDFLLEIRLEEGLIGEQEAYRRLDGWAKDKGIGTR
jgi:poly(A) polymerase